MASNAAHGSGTSCPPGFSPMPSWVPQFGISNVCIPNLTPPPVKGPPNPLDALNKIGGASDALGKSVGYVFEHPWVLIVAIAALFLLIASAKGLVTGS